MKHPASMIAVARLLAASVVSAQEDPLSGYTVTPNVVYGTGIIKTDGVERSRDLWMDVWQPANASPKP